MSGDSQSSRPACAGNSRLVPGPADYKPLPGLLQSDDSSFPPIKWEAWLLLPPYPLRTTSPMAVASSKADQKSLNLQLLFSLLINFHL